MNAMKFRKSLYPIILGNGAVLLFGWLGTKIGHGEFAPGFWMPIYCMFLGYLLMMQFFFIRWKIEPVATYNIVVPALYLGFDQLNALVSAATLSFILATAIGFLVGRWIRGNSWLLYFVGCSCIHGVVFFHTLNASSLVDKGTAAICVALALVPLAATILFVTKNGASFDAAFLRVEEYA